MAAAEIVLSLRDIAHLHCTSTDINITAWCVLVEKGSMACDWRTREVHLRQ